MPRLIHEDEREDARIAHAMERHVHPVLRHLHWPEPETAKCRACGERHLLSDLTDDLLCAEHDRVVKELEEGRL